MRHWQLKVTVFNQGKPVFSASFEHSPVTIGGLPKNDVVLDDPFVSGEHAWVSISRGKAIYHDRSRNGSFLGTLRIETRDIELCETILVPPFELLLEVNPTNEGRLTVSRDNDQWIPLPMTPAEGIPIEALSTQIVPQPKTSTVSPLHLQIMKGPPEVQGRKLELDCPSRSLGRGEEADLRFDIPTLSRLHAEFSWFPVGWRIKDLESSNGIYVNNQRMTIAWLGVGDTITFGRDLVIVVQDPTQEQGDHQKAETASPLRRESTAVPVLEIQEARASGRPEILILRMRGRVDGYNYTILTEKLNQILDSRERLLVIDFTQMLFIDHTGLGALVNAASRLDRLGGQLRLIGIGPKLQEAFELSRLDTLFRGRLADDEMTAIGELAAYRRS